MAYAPPTPGAGAGPPAAAPAAPPEKETGQNALLPRTLFSDQVKPGDTITLKVSAVYGDEVEVSATTASEQEPEEAEEMPTELTADQEIEAAAGEDTYGIGYPKVG